METEQSASLLPLQQVQADQELKLQLDGRLVVYANRLGDNIERVSRLLGFFDVYLHEDESGEDILRAAVVFIHAYLEDLLRTLAEELLPESDENNLKPVPLAGLSGRPEKFHLGNLVQHRGKTVDELLRQSVKQHLDRKTFNNKGEIEELLEKLGFDLSQDEKHLAAIQEMILRRHQIVHRADMVNESGKQVLQPIKRIRVTQWLDATVMFTSSLIGRLMQRLPEILKQKTRPGT